MHAGTVCKLHPPNSKGCNELNAMSWHVRLVSRLFLNDHSMCQYDCSATLGTIWDNPFTLNTGWIHGVNSAGHNLLLSNLYSFLHLHNPRVWFDPPKVTSCTQWIIGLALPFSLPLLLNPPKKKQTELKTSWNNDHLRCRGSLNKDAARYATTALPCAPYAL